MADLAKNGEGRYITDGLDAKTFGKVFDAIGRDQRKKRRKARHTLTPGRLKNKTIDDILQIGKKSKTGTFFTLDDLKGFEQNRGNVREKYDSKTAGITWAQLVSSSKEIDIKRANNAVDDGSGISRATPLSLKHNIISIRVEASSISAHQHHMVRFRLEEWDQIIDDVVDDEKTARTLTKQLCAGRVSFDCDCGRHQYWYRYIATAGNFALTPPKEYAYPKIRNPKLQGLACKHVIHSLTRLQSPSWQIRIAIALQKASRRVAYGDDSRKTTQHFGKNDEKDFNRNRKAKTDITQAKREWDIYQKRQTALDAKLSKGDGKLEALRSQLTKARKVSEAQKKRVAEKEAALKKEQGKIKALEQRLADQYALKRQSFVDAMIMTGKTLEEAEKMFVDYARG